MKSRSKRIVSILIMLCLTITLMTACQTNKAPAPASSSAPAAAPASAPAESKPKLDYPKKPITIVLPVAAGGGTDIGVRILTKYAEKYVGQPLIVTNIDGAGGETGLMDVINSPADGYKIAGLNSPQIMASAIRKTKYDVVNDFTGVSLQVCDPRVFAVRADDDRFKTFEDFKNYAKNNPGKLSIGDSGAGSTGHYTTEAFNFYGQVKANPIHFGGNGESRVAFLGKHIDAVSQSLGETVPMLAEKQARILAIATEKRDPKYPDIPTFKEMGVDLVLASNRGFGVRKGTSQEIVDFLDNAFKKAMEEPGYAADMAKVGLPVTYLGAKEFTAQVKAEKATFDTLVAKIGAGK